MGFGDGSSLTVILPPSVSLVNGIEEELELPCARTVLLAVSTVDAANNIITVGKISAIAIETIFIIEI
jgi:hypothetical protein